MAIGCEHMELRTRCAESVLYVWEHNIPAYSLYQKYGYMVAEQTENGAYMKKRLCPRNT